MMKTECNPLLRSWNEFVRLKHDFYRLRRFGFAFMESDPMVPSDDVKCGRPKRSKRKGRR